MRTAAPRKGAVWLLLAALLPLLVPALASRQVRWESSASWTLLAACLLVGGRQLRRLRIHENLVQARRLLAPSSQPQAADPVDGDFFVRIEDGEFVLGCNKFYVSGWNQWEVVDAAAGGPKLSGATIPTNQTGPTLIRSMLDNGVASGFNTMRFWGYAINPQYTLQTKPGVYNEVGSC